MRLGWTKSFSRKDRSFFLLVDLPARYVKLSRYERFLLVENISNTKLIPDGYFPIDVMCVSRRAAKNGHEKVEEHGRLYTYATAEDP